MLSTNSRWSKTWSKEAVCLVRRLVVAWQHTEILWTIKPDVIYTYFCRWTGGGVAQHYFAEPVCNSFWRTTEYLNFPYLLLGISCPTSWAYIGTGDFNHSSTPFTDCVWSGKDSAFLSTDRIPSQAVATTWITLLSLWLRAAIPGTGLKGETELVPKR